MGGKVLELFSERLHREGRQEGMQEGMQEGIESEKLASLQKLIKNGGMSLEQAMMILEIPMEEQEFYKEKTTL